VRRRTRRRACSSCSCVGSTKSFEDPGGPSMKPRFVRNLYFCRICFRSLFHTVRGLVIKYVVMYDNNMNYCYSNFQSDGPFFFSKISHRTDRPTSGSRAQASTDKAPSSRTDGK
jgi:hypothetical protein